MYPGPSIFVSFSRFDEIAVKQLLGALKNQGVEFWDYSDEGQELNAGSQLINGLKHKIDSCDYFLAVISASSINHELAPVPIFEVRYAIDSGKAKDRLIPLLLDNPPSDWSSRYKELSDLVYISTTTDNKAQLQDAVRRICTRLGRTYTPPSLLDKSVFFADPALNELHDKKLNNANYLDLLSWMSSAADEYLTLDSKEEDNKWRKIKEQVTALLHEADRFAPNPGFVYPRVLKGVAELKLKELENAEASFLQATLEKGADDKWLGLAYAGLGHTYFIKELFDKSVAAFKRALELIPDDKKLRINYLGALAYSGEMVLDGPIDDLLADPAVSGEDRVKLVTLKGIINYKQADYESAIDAFASLGPDGLNETGAVYYALALRENGNEDEGITVLENVADRFRSDNLYHHLAYAYLHIGSTYEAVRVYETILTHAVKSPEFVRQVLVEYAQLIRTMEGPKSKKAQEACERAVTLTAPQSKADCFFNGFAFHLLGKSEMARYFFDLSCGFSSEFYDQLELKDDF